MSYTHLSLEERYYIELERKKGISMTKIAAALERSQSTLSRELSRNKGERGYRHQQANAFAVARFCQKQVRPT